MKKQQGVTLMELMVVMAIVGILAAIAYPAYGQYTRKTRRNLAAGCLQEYAQYLERWYTSNMTYEGAAGPTCQPEIEGFYAVTHEITGPREFTATATPINGQARDKCGVMTLDEKGNRDSEGSTASGCW
jgi:type IV pilus assembly protein PilE